MDFKRINQKYDEKENMKKYFAFFLLEQEKEKKWLLRL